jgi:hypothetical protein
MAPTPSPPAKARTGFYIEWTAISYRTVLLYSGLGLVLVGVILYLMAPVYVTQKANQLLGVLTRQVGRSIEGEAAGSKREAHFVNIDGTVKVKKARSREWISAGYNISLEKGDLVETGSNGAARIIFADGTNYLLKPSALIAVEESREDPSTKATKVEVQVSSGRVDLATGKFEVAGSTSRVSFADAVANLDEESRAMIHNDPTQNVHELTVEQGNAQVTRGTSRVQLGPYEQVNFSAERPGLLKTRIIEPPTLFAPKNMELKLAKDPKSTGLDFAWSQVPGAVAYHLQISPSVMLSNFVVDKKLARQTSYRVAGLEEGTYYWIVSAIDAKGTESEPSMANRLNLVQEVGAEGQTYLQVTKIVQHGRVVEVQGKTEPGSTVIINNEQVFSISPDGTFRHFTSPLPKAGSNLITITAQNRKGDTSTIRETVVVE